MHGCDYAGNYAFNQNSFQHPLIAIHSHLNLVVTLTEASVASSKGNGGTVDAEQLSLH